MRDINKILETKQMELETALGERGKPIGYHLKPWKSLVTRDAR